MAINREIKESPLHQGADETIAYTLTTTPWGSSPGSLAVKLYSVNLTTGALTDVSSTKLSGSASAVGDVITTPAVTALAAGTTYRLEIKFTCSGNIFEAWASVVGET
jgi:hypothetical protein